MRRVLVLLALSLGLVLACDAWTTWDDIFNRSSVGSSARGWTGGDGAISAELPNDRAFWIFGDSLITGYNSLGQRPEDATPLGTAANTAFGNTIAIQTGRSSPSASNITFFGRLTNGSPKDITGGIDSTTEVDMFFSKSFLGLPSSSPDTIFYWPMGAECLNCSGTNPRLVVAFAKIGKDNCDPHPTTGTALNCIPACSLSGASDGPTCHKGFLALSTVVARFKGIDQTPDKWTRDGTSLEILQPNNAEPTLWGAAFVDTGSGIWIFGRKIHTASNPVTSDLVVATAATDVLAGTSWQYWNGSAWKTSNATLGPVATKVGSLDSVDKITRGTTTRYLLVHGDTDHLLYARVSNLPSGTNPPTWPANSATTPRIDLVSVEFSLYAQMLNLANHGHCSPDLSGAVPNYSSCATVYHGLAHAHLSMNDGSGPLFIPTSYVVPSGPNPFFDSSKAESDTNPLSGTGNAAYYRPKFTAVEIDKLKPWCTTDCWEGIVHDYAARQVGSQSVTYAYDVSASPGFYASLTRTSGSANMRVDFYNGLTFVSGQTCPLASGSTTVLTCKLTRPTVPTAATSAIVTVSGAATDAYSLLTHYAGFY